MLFQSFSQDNNEVINDFINKFLFVITKYLHLFTLMIQIDLFQDKILNLFYHAENNHCYA